MWQPNITVNRFHTALQAGGKLWDNPDSVEIYEGHIHLVEGKYHNLPNEYRHFTGVLSADDWPSPIVVGEQSHTYDHFLPTDFLNVATDASRYTALLGSSATATITYPANTAGGAVFLQTGTGNGGMAGDGAQLAGNDIWSANNGNMAIQFDVSLSNIANVVAFIGFSDTTALEMPCTGAAGNVITGIADDFCGMFYDSAMDNDTWWLVSRRAAGTVQQYNTTITPATANGEFNRWRLQFDGATSVSLYRNDGSVALTTLTSPMIGTSMVGPFIAVFPRSVTDRTMRLARIQVYGRQDITLV
jgi:hypothetical protein